MVVLKRTFSVGVPRIISRVFFDLSYRLGKPRWDTGITPPEIRQLIEDEKFPPGRALDIGCGTGTNAIYLAQHGFEVIGVDYMARAIQRARQKAQAANAAIEFRAADVMAPGALGKPFDLILDIGCFHSLDPYGRVRYADNLVRWSHQGTLYLVYSFFPRSGALRGIGVSRDEMERLMSPNFRLLNFSADKDSAWYRWERN